MDEQKILTKEQKFNLEMLYKSLLDVNDFLLAPSYVYNKPKKYIKRVDIKTDDIAYLNVFACNLDKLLKNNDDKYTFLDTYKDILNWTFILKGNGFYNANVTTFIEFATKYKKYLSPNCWNQLTKKCTFNYYTDFIRKFKDRLNWNYLSKFFPFTIDFLVEMKDYVKLEIYLQCNDTNNKTKQALIDYLKNHLEEVLKIETNREGNKESSEIQLSK